MAQQNEVIEYVDYGGQPYGSSTSQPAPYPGSSSDEIYADVMRDERVTNIIAQINPDNLLDDIEHRLRGEKRDLRSGAWVKRDLKRDVLDEMVDNYMEFLSSILNQNTSMSNFSAKDINKIMNLVIEYVMDDLDTREEIYGFGSDFNIMTKVAFIVVANIFTVLKRAENGMEARRVFGALKVTESILGAKPQQKSGLDYLKFWQ